MTGALTRIFDLEGDYLERHFGKQALFMHAVPEDDEAEIKILHPEEFFPKLHTALVRHPDIVFCPKGMQGKNYVLANLGLDTYDKHNPGNTRLIHRAGYQARLRIGLTLEDEGHFYRDMELNLKSNLAHSGPHTVRKEFEAHANGFSTAFALMKEHKGVLEARDLNFETLDPDSLFIQAIAMSSRAHGEFAHVMEKHGCIIKYLACNDHTVHVDNHGSVVLGEDCESEYEAREIVTFKPRTITNEEKKGIIAASQQELKNHLLGLSPALQPSHRSKLGRSLEALAYSLNVQRPRDENEAVISALSHRMHVDEFLGDTKTRAAPYGSGNDRFMHNLARIARAHLLTGDDIVRDYVYAPLPHDPLVIPGIALQ